MTSFTFQTVPAIVFEFGAARRLGSLLRAHRFTASAAAVITDRYLHTSGLLKPALDDLAENGFRVTIVDDVVADPPESVVLQAAEQLSVADIDLVIGFGGGSSMDVAKLVSLMLRSKQPLAEMYGVDQVRGERLPLVQIPTTAGTGSEMTPIAIVTTSETTKLGVVSPVLYADLSILDPELTLALPPRATAATGIDAMVHAIEAFTSRHRKNPLSDSLALRALGLLTSNLLAACTDGSNRTAREEMLLGAMLAGQAFANAPVAAVHALALPLGAIFHVPHGVSNALLLPHVLRFNSPVAAELYAELADAVAWASQEDRVLECGSIGVLDSGSVGTPNTPVLHHSSTPSPMGETPMQHKVAAFIEYLEQLRDAVGLEKNLRAVGVSEEDLGRLAAEAMKQTRLLVNNPREVTLEDATAIYRAAL
jgi:alcohol dehydrogenase